MFANISGKLIPTDGNTYREKVVQNNDLDNTCIYTHAHVSRSLKSTRNFYPFASNYHDRYVAIWRRKKRNNEEEEGEKKREMEEEKCENEEAEKSAAKFPGRKEGRYWLLSGAYFLVGEEIRSSMPKEEFLEEERMEGKKKKKKGRKRKWM